MKNKKNNSVSVYYGICQLSFCLLRILSTLILSTTNSVNSVSVNTVSVNSVSVNHGFCQLGFCQFGFCQLRILSTLFLSTLFCSRNIVVLCWCQNIHGDILSLPSASNILQFFPAERLRFAFQNLMFDQLVTMLTMDEQND